MRWNQKGKRNWPVSLPLLALALIMLGSCASIPQESPRLSHEIGQRISDMQAAHLTLVHRYFDLKRAQVDSLFQRQWIPAYAESFFGQPQVENYWDRLVTEGDPAERVEFLTRIGPRMLERIRQKRAEYMKPLNQLEAEVVSNLREEYRQMLSANNTLTSFLASSSAVAQNRERYLEWIGIDTEGVANYVDRVDRQSEQIMNTIRHAN